ncbi:MAG: amidohydrolase family protein [Myxococcota bacterium]|nr:amidohydrolase family protein [Myxococcota bacterium]
MSRLVFRDANLLDGEHPARPGQTIVVENDTIVQVDETPVEAAPDDRVIDLAGRTLMPGMVTSHFHSTYDDISILPAPLGLEAPPAYLAIVASKNLRLALMSGFTSVVSAGSINDDIDPQCKRAIEDGVVEGPRFVPGGRGLDTVGGYQDTESWWWELGNKGAGLCCSGPDEFLHAVREEISRGVEMIKIFPSGGHGVNEALEETSFDREELETVVRTAHQRGARVRAHCPWKQPILECIRAGVDIIDHGDRLDAELIDTMLANDTTLVPSAYFIKLMLGDTQNLIHATETQRAPIRADFENMLRALPAANEAGVRLCIGDDYGIMLLPHAQGAYAAEMEFYAKECGIPALDVIRWATRNGGELMPDAVGTIEPGKLADLLVIDGDPSQDIAILQREEKLLGILKGGTFVKDPEAASGVPVS